MITLTDNTIDNKDITELWKWLQSKPQLTYHEKTREFEEKFAEYVGSKYAVFVNSGSSANLLALYTLKLHTNRQNVIFPALCWATNPAPAHILGFNLYCVDVNLDNLSFDLTELKSTLEQVEDPIIMLIDVLGLQPNFVEILRLCKQYNAILLEDACESLGSTYIDKKLGTFGLLGTYSFYHAHQCSTIEGGIVVTNNYDLYELLLSCRSHGWNRDWDTTSRKLSAAVNNISTFNDQFRFYYPGFNLRPTEIQSVLGLQQLKKLPGLVQKRSVNFNTYHNRLSEISEFWTPNVQNNDSNIISNFGFPIISNKRQNIIETLENKVQCRPLIAGSILEHPVNEIYGLTTITPNASKIDKEGLYLPNHSELSEKNIHQVCDLVEKAINE